LRWASGPVEWGVEAQGLGSVERDGLYPSTLAYINGVLELRARFG